MRKRDKFGKSEEEGESENKKKLVEENWKHTCVNRRPGISSKARRA